MVFICWINNLACKNQLRRIEAFPSVCCSNIMIGEINEHSVLITAAQEGAAEGEGEGRAEVSRSKIEDKIEMMRQSITQLSILSRGKNIENVRRLEQEQDSSASFVEQQQRKLLLELALLEDTLARIERERIMQTARLSSHHLALDLTARTHEQEAREESRRNREQFEDYRDQITDLKVRLAELEVGGKQRLDKFEREWRGRVGNCIKSMEINDQEGGKGKLERQSRQLQALRAAIDEEGKQQQRDLARTASRLGELRELISSRCQEESRRQKEGFGQNYRALEELFVLLSEQYGEQR